MQQAGEQSGQQPLAEYRPFQVLFHHPDDDVQHLLGPDNCVFGGVFEVDEVLGGDVAGAEPGGGGVSFQAGLFRYPAGGEFEARIGNGSVDEDGLQGLSPGIEGDAPVDYGGQAEPVGGPAQQAFALGM